MAVEFIDLALALHQANALKSGDFILASGNRSRTYWHIPSLASEVGPRNTVVETYLQMLDECIPFDLLADVPHAPSFLVAIMADRLSLPMITPHPVPKDHGHIVEISGSYRPGNIAVVVEGVLTTGGSALKTIQVLERNGIVVRDVLGLIDAEAGARETLANYNVYTAATHRKLMDFFAEANLSA